LTKCGRDDIIIYAADATEVAESAKKNKKVVDKLEKL
jgi:hypothetical protein